ncbi:HPF/RaiA family ribosome-associated protein [Azospirillum sp. SYSU D00513]|uniref:HPF/RaiA family ribosome-associated protein n=1 Tax=Azospirillum sp. SYSU D00513 TaxID=2812561 RepID=UPI001A972FF3|nr:HPF/RaiA family ribosome-associated protein [Azospirillum sp. SYSU D00513]
MDTNLEIAFHNMDTQPELETYIRERAEKLEKLYERIVGMRVSVENTHRQHRTGNVYDVHIEVMVPGTNVVVSRKPHKAKERYAHPDARTSIRDAFEAAERQLKEYKQKIRNDVKAHDAEVPGRVSQLYPNEDHGFITTSTGTQLYFHRNSCINVNFEDLKSGDPVKYIEATGDTGPTASKVWLAAGADNELHAS